MVYFPAVLYSGVTQATTFAATTLTANIVSDFFRNLFLHPGENYMAMMAVAGVAVVACVGLAFLIKLVYDKYNPEH